MGVPLTTVAVTHPLVLAVARKGEVEGASEGLGNKTLGEGVTKGVVEKELVKVLIADNVPTLTIPSPPPAEGLGKGLEGVGPRKEAETLRDGVSIDVSVPSLVALPNPALPLLPVGETLGDRDEEDEFVESADEVGDREEMNEDEPPPLPSPPMELVDDMEGEGDTRGEREEDLVVEGVRVSLGEREGDLVVEGVRESLGEREGDVVIEGEEERRGDFEEVAVVEVLREVLGDFENKGDTVNVGVVVTSAVMVVTVSMEGESKPVGEALLDTVPPPPPPIPSAALVGEDEKDSALL